MKDFKAKLIYKKLIGENTVAFYFDIKDSGYEFEAGQYAYFTLTNCPSEDIKGNSRPLSIASSPDNKDYLMIAARKSSSVFIDNLFLLPYGSEVFISKAKGDLFRDQRNDPASVFIAGGIGITPVRSVIEKLIRDKNEMKIFLFHANRKLTQSAFYREFIKWESLNDSFKFIPVIDDDSKKGKDEVRKLDGLMLKKYLNDFADKTFYIVGPPEMVDSVKQMLTATGVEEKHIRIEKFI
ncbi:MAG: FAD-dependent oxidoreductase [bacterium]|nr:FAD-dependent oxidoreductase [bacterium]